MSDVVAITLMSVFHLNVIFKEKTGNSFTQYESDVLTPKEYLIKLFTATLEVLGDVFTIPVSLNPDNMRQLPSGCVS